MSVELSIIVPAYNAENYLEPCIESIMASTYRNFEVLLVDDGSTDGTGALCDQLAEKYDQIQVFHTENRGLSMARNLGIDHASGKYIGFVDSDDLIAPYMYAEMISRMEDDIQLVCCRYCRSQYGEMTELDFSGNTHIHTGEQIWEQILCNYYNVNVWSKLFRNTLLKTNKIRFKPGYVMEDLYFITDYLSVCTKAAFLEDQMYYYMDTPNGIMNLMNNGRTLPMKYISYPRGHVYMSNALSRYPKLYSLTRAQAAMAYQRVLRRIESEDKDFIMEAQTYVRKNGHLLMQYSWGHTCFLSGIVLSISYPLWRCLFRKK